MRTLILSIVVFFAAQLQAQTPGTRLIVEVNVMSVVTRGDTTGISYTVRNSSGSQDSLFTFAVDAPSRVIRIAAPPPDSIWRADSVFSGNQPAALWVTLDLLSPGDISPLLTFESLGLPGIVTHWAEGGWPLPSCCDDDSAASGSAYTLVMRSVQGKTVGVEVWPTNRSAYSLLVRLRGLTQTACESPLLWIADSGLCTQLISDIDAAESFRASGATVQAQNSLNHYKALLSGPDPGTPAAGVTSSAYWLLRANADIVHGTL